MNVDDAATYLAMFGIKTLNEVDESSPSVLPRSKWMKYTVMAISGGLGTTLSLIQCAREGSNLSPVTATILSTNIIVLGQGVAGVYCYSFK